MDILVLIGRIFFVPLFLSSGINHLTNTDAMAGYAKSKGVPFAKAGVAGSGVLLIVGSLMVLLGIWPDVGALLLFIFLIPTAAMMHPFWTETDPGTKQQEMIQFTKDLALAGAALMLVTLFAYVGTELGLVITQPLLDMS